MSQFDQILNRRQTNSEKWDSIEKNFGVTDLEAFWVADMDFRAAPAIQKALSNYVAAGIYGYHTLPDSLYQAIISWQARRHHYLLKKEEILFNSGVVPSLVMCVQAYTHPGDAVLIHDPVYRPFSEVIEKNQRKLVRSTLLTVDGKFQMDFYEMESLIIQNDIKLFILCNPQNPGGRVWSKEELKQLGQLCQKHQVMVISDEIHQDLILAPYTFTSFQTIDPSFEAFSVVLTSATKTFNLAGVKNSMLFIKNQKLREKMIALQEATRQSEINSFGLIATEAAYNEGEEWLENLLDYIKENIKMTTDFFKNHLPKVKVMEPEGTYLMWLDFSAFNLTDDELTQKLIYEARVVLNQGDFFGPAGTQHVRLNVACSRKLLEKGLKQIAEIFAPLGEI
ncbi:MalY/PatB family protein [Enterococcus sp. LJL98]